MSLKTEEYDHLGALPKRKDKSASVLSRGDSFIDLAKDIPGKIKQKWQRWRSRESDTSSYKLVRENELLRNALRTSQRENEKLRNDQVSKKVGQTLS